MFFILVVSILTKLLRFVNLICRNGKICVGIALNFPKRENIWVFWEEFSEIDKFKKTIKTRKNKKNRI